jgi:hypothetical protein
VSRPPGSDVAEPGAGVEQSKAGGSGLVEAEPARTLLAEVYDLDLERKVMVAREPDGRMLELAWVAWGECSWIEEGAGTSPRPDSRHHAPPNRHTDGLDQVGRPPAVCGNPALGSIAHPPSCLQRCRWMTETA